MKNRRRPSGFTLLELLVASAMASLLAFLIVQIFFELTDAVGLGVASNRIIFDTRSIGEQLERDFENQLAPSPFSATAGGVMVILNKEYVDTPVFDPENVYSIDTTIGSPVTTVRSDQISFIYDYEAKAIEPLCPGTEGSYSNSTAATDRVRIWYGHLLRTSSDGTDPTNTDLGEIGPNRFATHWILGRQALFFHESTLAAFQIHADGFIPGASVNGFGSDIDGGITQSLSSGLTDIAEVSYDDSSQTAYGQRSDTSLIGDGGTPTNGVLNDGQADAAYKLGAYGLTFGNDRLRVNPIPDGSTYWSSQIAQMHALFMSNVSDFIVEFAADAVDDAAIADNPALGANRSPDGSPDLDAQGNIQWYDGFNPPVWNSASYELITGAGTFVDPNDLNNSGTVTLSDHGFVFRHDYPNAWPYLIRFRIRLHDKDGRLTTFMPATSQRESGKWVEIVVKVNRS